MAATRPNILLIYSDQHRFDSVGVNGHPLAQTPTMDRLAAEGANFTSAFTPIPMCVPARCCMLSGQWPTRHGTIFNFDGETFKPLDTSIPTSTRTVMNAGYHNIHIGRWHVSPGDKHTPIDYGSHDYIPTWRYGKWRKAQGLKPAPGDQGWRGQTDPHSTPEQSFLGWSAGKVIDAMKLCQSEGEPFFIRWQMAEPHLPCRPCEPFASMYDPAQIQPWPGFADELANKPYIQKQMRATWDVEGMSWEQWAPVVARYLGVISQLDSQIGRVLETLEQMGIAGNTLVIYTTDHGDMCGSHGMVDKHYNMYEDIVHVPMMMRWPGVIPAGRTVDDFVSNAIDLPVTLCEAAGADAPGTFMGESLLPLAAGTGKGSREDIFASYHGNQFGGYSQRMVRDRRWKYVWNATDTDELYDLQTDPGELVNRIADTSCQEAITRLRERLLWWMDHTQDSLNNRWIRGQIEGGRKV